MVRVNFSQSRLAFLKQTEANHFWFDGRLRIVNFLVAKSNLNQNGNLIDLGCGTGKYLNHWTSFAKYVVGIDAFADQGFQYSQSKSITKIKGCVQNVPLQNLSVDTIVSLDVLEHLDDNVAISEINRIIKPGGKLIICVPATPGLWSIRDIVAGHQRRYTKKSITALINSIPELKIKKITYYQCFLFPAVYLARKFIKQTSQLSSEEQPSKLINTIFKFVNRMEFQLIRLGIPLPFGSSLLLLVEKKDVC